MSERDDTNRKDPRREDPAQPPQPSVVSVNRRPLYTVGVAALFVLFVLVAYLNPRPTTPREAPKAPPPADPNSILGRFLAEQESRARNRPLPPPPPLRPPVVASSASQGLPSGSAGPADPSSAGSPPIPGVYDPRWPSFLARGGSAPESSREARATPTSDRPVIRFRAGEKSSTPPADPLTEALMRLMPKAEEPPASAARPPEAISLTPGTATARSDRSNPSEAFLGSRPGGSGAQGPLKMSPALPGGSPFRLLEGSLIPATLETTIHSDLPGLATALVRRDTYDSVTGRYLLIPRGARLVGQYSSETQHGGSRLLLAWTRLLLPDGSSYDLARMPAADLAGASGLPARVNNHWGRLFGSALLLSVVSAGVQLSQAPNDSDLRRSSPTASEVASGALGQELGQVSTGLLRRELDLRPSLSLAAGTPFNVQVATDLEFPAPYARVRP